MMFLIQFQEDSYLDHDGKKIDKIDELFQIRKKCSI